MNIAGRTNRFIVFFTKSYNFAVHIFQILKTVNVFHTFALNHKLIISDRLDFQIVIKIHQFFDPTFRCLIQKRTI